MLKKIMPMLAVLAVFITACGPQGTPTMSAEDVQGTAVAAAWTMVAMTQAANPTATPLPPTETPTSTALATFTPVALPTQSTPLVLPTATQAAGGTDNCLKPLNIGEAGPQSEVRFENDSGGSVNLSLNLSTNAFGQCGYIGYALSKNQKLVVSIPKGVYFAYAWITYANGDTSTASGTVNNRPGDNHQFRVVIKKDIIIVP